ncbi:MAG: transposase [Gammaproteobacteria bacterium]|nr:transposase [Gammaproteobacteria bacterium]
MMIKTFTSALKKEFVELVLNGGYTLKKAVQMMIIGMTTLQRWLGQYKNSSPVRHPKRR